MKTAAFTLSGILCPLLCLFACELNYGVTGMHFDSAQFDRERASWQASGVTNYRYRVQWFSDGTGPLAFQIVVKGGTAYSVIDEKGYLSPEQSGAEAKFSGIDTIPNMFDRISELVKEDTERIAKGDSHLKGVEVHLSYDPRYHFISSLRYETYHHGDVSGGGGPSYTVTDFAVL